MIAVIFEVRPRDGQQQAYLELATQLAASLQRMDGFISVERFQSIADPGKMLSLSFWRDEAAVSAWRELESHRAAQSCGRHTLFADYRLRIASVARDYGLHDRVQAPPDSVRFHNRMN